MIIGLACHNSDWNGSQHKVFKEIMAGAEALGHQVLVCVPPADGLESCDVLFAWNTARREWWHEIRNKTIADGKKFFTMERGWFDRMDYTQIDHEGFNHTASWAHQVSGPAPIDGPERFRMLSELLTPRLPVVARDGGYALILGQTGSDTQLRQSEIHHPDTLCASVLANLPGGLEAKYRRHPLSKVEPDGIESLDGSLDDALAGARFVITINSNAGNDALWAGVPVLCLGPALYEIAGAARRTSVATLLPDMEFMCQGWYPDEKRVLSYFHWLASRQWNRQELEQGDCLKQLIGVCDGQD